MTPGLGTSTHCVDVDKMACSMTNKLNSFWSQFEIADNESRVYQIYRVPQHIRVVEHVAYEPVVLAIGPYHHGAPHLQAMEKIKWGYLNHILKLNCEVSVHDYLRAIAKLEKLTRTCYSEEIAMERKSFLQMLLLDGCFILLNVDQNIGTEPYSAATPTEIVAVNLGNSDAASDREHGCAQGIFLREEELIEAKMSQAGSINDNWKHGKDGQKSDEIGDWYSHLAWHDIFLQENQIPFFIVEKIYQIAVGKRVGLASLADKACRCVADVLRHYPTAIQESNRPEHIHHLLHLCHTYLRPSQKPCNGSEFQVKPNFFHRLLQFGHTYFRIAQKQEHVQHKLPMQQLNRFLAGELTVRWRCAVQYHEAGVRIKKRLWNKNDRHSLLDITFSNGVIEVPFFLMDENTESLFKNLIAFEQIDPQFGNDITAYVIFMSQFVSTPVDATLLAEKGIVVHMLDSDDEVPAIFNRLSKHVCFTFDSSHYLKSLCHSLEAHYQSRLNRWIAWLWINHFSNPWLALAVLAAVIVLLCTVVQTIYTVLAYVKPSS